MPHSRNDSSFFFDREASSHQIFSDAEGASQHSIRWRKRLVQLILLILALGAVLATFWPLIVPKQSPYSDPLVPALIVSNVNFGTIILNGQQLASHPPLKTMIHADANDVTLAAPPFQAYTCHFHHLTMSQTEHCLSTRESMIDEQGHLIDTRILGIFLLPDDLPPNQQAKALALINAALTPQQTSVPIGAYFARNIDQTGMITSQVTTIPLQAIATFTLARPSYLRLDPMNATLLTRPTWGIAFSLALHWRFTTPSGEGISDVTYPAAEGASLFLAYTSSTGWQPSKEVGEDLPSQLVGTTCSAGVQVLQQKTGRTFHSIILPAPATPAGCVMQVQDEGTPVGTFLWRFGVLFAADQTAHASVPTLPMAPPEELAAAEG